MNSELSAISCPATMNQELELELAAAAAELDGVTAPGRRDPYPCRQMNWSVVPGQNRATRRQRQMEAEIDRGARELEGAMSAGEGFETRVLPAWSPIGSREGHEVLTRLAATGLPGFGAPEIGALVTGVIIPDRGGQSYWNFPVSGLPGAVMPGNQSSHALRRYFWTSQGAALAEIRNRLVAIYRGVISAPSWLAGWQTAGEALHLIQDGYSCAHVERPVCAGGVGNRISYIRVFSPALPVTFGREHGLPTDSRDQIRLPSGALRPEASAAVTASREFLQMLQSHRTAPMAPGNAAGLTAFLNRHLSF